MSGDVQPRKRKDKKKKKDEGEPIFTPPVVSFTKEPSDDVNIHVHKEDGIGGGILTKVIFFILFSALTVLIGLIIIEHRGLTDSDVAQSHSAYSEIFEGWIHDEKYDHHTLDDHDNEPLVEDDDDLHDEDDHLDDHFNENEETEEHDEEIAHSDEDQSIPESDEKVEDNISQAEESQELDQTEEDSEEQVEYTKEESEEDDMIESQQNQEDSPEADEDDISAGVSQERYETEDDVDDVQEVSTLEQSEEVSKDLEESVEASEEQTDNEEENLDTPHEKDDDEEDERDESVDKDTEDVGADVSKGDDDQDEDKSNDVDLTESGEKHEDSKEMEEEHEEKVEVLQALKEPKASVSSKEATQEQEPNKVTDNLDSLNGEGPSEVVESDSDKLSDNNEYEFSNLTNEKDWPIRTELDEAQNNLQHNAANALKMFEKILEKYPSSPRGSYGLAQAYDQLAEKKKSNELLEKAISEYLKLSELEDLPDALFRAALERCIDRTQFKGEYSRAIVAHLKLINRFPNEPTYRNQLAVTYLTIGRVEQARSVLKEILQKWPDDACALVHYGFIWKTVYNNLEKGVYFMQKGVNTNAPCVLHGRFYFHLGDAYFRLGNKEKAFKLYEEGVKHKLFLSKYQRSLYNVPRLTARPWWNKTDLVAYKNLFADLEKNWKLIRDEGEAILNQKGYFQDESENLKDTGQWKQFELFSRARKNIENCKKTPQTCKILERHRAAIACRRGQTKFSVMHPGTHVWAHCGPTNCRLRVHLGLRVPHKTFIRVADETRSWQEGKLLVFDDSFEHEVWHNGSDIRLVLIVDVWHPELSMFEKKTLSSI